MPVIPIFVWVVLSIAILIMATGYFIVNPVLDSLNGGFGNAVVISVVICIGAAIWMKKRS